MIDSPVVSGVSVEVNCGLPAGRFESGVIFKYEGGQIRPFCKIEFLIRDVVRTLQPHYMVFYQLSNLRGFLGSCGNSNYKKTQILSGRKITPYRVSESPARSYVLHESAF